MQKTETKSNKIINYLKSSREELKKVSWPTKKETTKYSLLVIGISIGVSLYLGGLDFLFNLALKYIIK